MIRGIRVPVRITTREALRILDVADVWAARTGHDVRLVSANDHAHSRGSAHYRGLALDFHSSDLDGLSRVLRAAGFRVLWRVRGHYDHVHAENTPAAPPVRRRQAAPEFRVASTTRPGPTADVR